MIQLPEVRIFLLQAAHEALLHIAANIVVMLGFVIQLPADNRRMVLHMGHQRADNFSA